MDIGKSRHQVSLNLHAGAIMMLLRHPTDLIIAPTDPSDACICLMGSGRESQHLRTLLSPYDKPHFVLPFNYSRSDITNSDTPVGSLLALWPLQHELASPSSHPHFLRLFLPLGLVFRSRVSPLLSDHLSSKLLVACLSKMVNQLWFHCDADWSHFRGPVLAPMSLLRKRRSTKACWVSIFECHHIFTGSGCDSTSDLVPGWLHTFFSWVAWLQMKGWDLTEWVGWVACLSICILPTISFCLMHQNTLRVTLDW